MNHSELDAYRNKVIRFIAEAVKDDDYDALKADVEGTSLASKLPVNTVDMQTVARKVAKALVDADPATWRQVLRAIASRRQGNPRFVEALVMLETFEKMKAERAANPGDLLDFSAPPAVDAWLCERVEIFTGWSRKKSEFYLCKTGAKDAQPNRQCDLHLRLLALTASVWRLNTAKSETRKIENQLNVVLTVLTSCKEGPIPNGNKRNSVRCALDRLVQEFKTIGIDRDYPNPIDDAYERMRGFLPRRLMMSEAEVLLVVDHLELLHKEVLDRSHDGDDLFISQPLLDFLPRVISGLKEVLARREKRMAMALRDGMKCDVASLKGAADMVTKALGGITEEELAVWAPGKGRI